VNWGELFLIAAAVCAGIEAIWHRSLLAAAVGFIAVAFLV
jgi:hypothetical protein